MESFNLNITVDDCCISKCNTNNVTTNQIITNLNEFIPLQCYYYLKIINVNPTNILISIDNDNIFFVRRLFVNVPIKICIPNNCACHTLTIKVNSITA